jgi:hypothetical protein
MKDVDVAPIAGAPTGDANPSVGSTLLERLRAGQTDAWERLARLYGQTVYVWCRGAGVPEADAADVSQEVFAAVARHLADFRREGPGDSFRGWLWTITRKGSSRARESSAPRARIRWPTSIPDGASEQPSLSRAIGDDERLDEYLRAFAGGHFHLLILVGAGGLAKSRSVRAVLDGKTCWIEGNATPFGMYVKLYRHRDQFVVIDDVDALYADRSGVRLLKCLCQTEEEKAVAWHPDARSLERQGIPREFVTRSRVAIIANDWKTLDENVAALQAGGQSIRAMGAALTRTRISAPRRTRRRS